MYQNPQEEFGAAASSTNQQSGPEGVTDFRRADFSAGIVSVTARSEGRVSDEMNAIIAWVQRSFPGSTIGVPGDNREYRIEGVFSSPGGEGTSLLLSNEDGQFFSGKLIPCPIMAGGILKRAAIAEQTEELLALHHSVTPTGIQKVIELIPFDSIEHVLLIREYVPGKTLRQVMNEKNGEYAPPEVLRLIQEISEQLRFLHEPEMHRETHGAIVHRDIKPENIVVDPEGHYHLIDFGISFLYKDGITRRTEMWHDRSPYLCY